MSSQKANCPLVNSRPWVTQNVKSIPQPTCSRKSSTTVPKECVKYLQDTELPTNFVKTSVFRVLKKLTFGRNTTDQEDHLNCVSTCKPNPTRGIMQLELEDGICEFFHQQNQQSVFWPSRKPFLSLTESTVFRTSSIEQVDKKRSCGPQLCIIKLKLRKLTQT